MQADEKAKWWRGSAKMAQHFSALTARRSGLWCVARASSYGRVIRTNLLLPLPLIIISFTFIFFDWMAIRCIYNSHEHAVTVTPVSKGGGGQDWSRRSLRIPLEQRLVFRYQSTADYHCINPILASDAIRCTVDQNTMFVTVLTAQPAASRRLHSRHGAGLTRSQAKPRSITRRLSQWAGWLLLRRLKTRSLTCALACC